MSAFVHIHGWCCDASAMAPVAAALPEARHTTLTLPGFGGTPAVNDLSITAQAHWVLGQILEPAILCGHSMGAQIALQAAVLAPDQVTGVVLLDPARLVPTPKAEAFFGSMRDKLARFAFRDIIVAFARQQIVSASDPAAVDALVAVMAATDPQVARTAWDAILSFEAEAALAALTRPGLMIVVERPMNRPADVARLVTQAPFATGQVTGSGHMLQFEVMDQVAAMIRRWMALTA